VIAFERLAMLALGELPDAEAAEVEDHVLGCDECAARLERLVDLGQSISALARAGSGGMLAGRELVALLDREGLVTRKYAMPAGGQIACAVDARDIYSAIHLTLDTRGARRVDLLYDSPIAGYRIEDVPFDAGGVTFVQPGDYLRTLPTQRSTIRLVAVEDAGERPLGEFVLNHTGYAKG
jgi:hypothetical protein